MTDVEFLLSLYGILLGLSLAEILGGLARVIEGRDRMKSGKLLMSTVGAVLLVDIGLFWSWIWDARGSLRVGDGTILAGLAIAGLYYVAAYLSFPRGALPAHTRLEAHFRNVKRWVVGPVLAANAVAFAAIMALTRGEGWCPVDFAAEAAYFALLAAAFFVSDRRRLTFLFGGAILICLAYAVVEIWPGIECDAQRAAAVRQAPCQAIAGPSAACTSPAPGQR